MIIDTRFKIIKFIDHWIGSLLCIILGIIHRITHPFYRPVLNIPLKNSPKSILVIKFFGLGSILLSSALLKSIKNKYPYTKIIFLTFKYNADLVKQLQLSEEVRTVDTRDVITFLSSTIFNLIYFSFHKPKITIDLEFFSKFTTIMSYLSGARYRVGFYIVQFWRDSLVNVPIYFNYARHILEIYNMVGKSINVDVVNLTPSKIPVSAQEEAFINEWFLQRNISGNDFLLGVNINASDLAYCRRWPRERFAEVINALLKENNDLKIFLTGGMNEKKYVSTIFKLLDEDIKDRVFDLSALLSFKEFIALLNRLHLFLTNDSGPFHLANAQGIPTASIWGPGSPDLYGPYGKEKERHRVVYKRWNCSPCLYIYRTDAGFFCRNTVPCLNVIESQEVAHLVKEAINELSNKNR